MQKKKPWVVSSCAFLIKEVLMKPSFFRTRERKSQSFRTREKITIALDFESRKHLGNYEWEENNEGTEETWLDLWPQPWVVLAVTAL